MRACEDAKAQMELRECDGVNDWQMVCPNSCRTLDDSLRHFLTNPAKDRIAVWGDHDKVWTGEGRDGLELLVMFHVYSGIVLFTADPSVGQILISRLLCGRFMCLDRPSVCPSVT